MRRIKGEEDSDKWYVECKGPVVAVAPVLRVLPLCAKKYQSLQKRHVKSGLSLNRSGLSLDLVATVEAPGSLRKTAIGLFHSRLNAKARRVGPGLFGFAY